MAMIKGFISLEQEITHLVQHVVAIPSLHGLWLNTLSYLENCGARKIASCEHPTAVKEEMLKHAAEEFRHAFYLKTQLNRIGQSNTAGRSFFAFSSAHEPRDRAGGGGDCIEFNTIPSPASSIPGAFTREENAKNDRPAVYEDYRRSYLLGGWAAYHYLNALDLQTSRYLKSQGATPAETKQLAYLLVTYAIELRAGELYPIYQTALRQNLSKVQVQSILLEEKEHLQEMKEALSLIPSSCTHIQAICTLEAKRCQQWLTACTFHQHAQMQKPSGGSPLF
jgi:hypothetical protein